MRTSVITPKSKKELKSAITSTLDGYSYNLFEGEIRKGDKYAAISYRFFGNNISVEVLYWQDGKNKSSRLSFTLHNSNWCHQ
ncbi:hypothetical protein NXX20_11830 [Bacteroides stercoris]|nr:hypothetical protein [Bacteroides stercoris]